MTIMARISEKALRPRQYVFTRLTPERIAQLTPGVRKLREQEKRQALTTRAAMRAAERHVAARHAENIMAGITTAQPESDQIASLERELHDLRQRKRRMFDSLRRSLAADTPTPPTHPYAPVSPRYTPPTRLESLSGAGVANSVGRSANLSSPHVLRRSSTAAITTASTNGPLRRKDKVVATTNSMNHTT